MTLRTCAFHGCDRPHYGLGYCKPHHRQHSEGKELQPLRGRALPDLVRFWSQVEYKSDTGCLIWEGTKSADGYGRFGVRGRKVQAHRFAWEMTGHPLPEPGWWNAKDNPDGLLLDHDNPAYGCGNPSCVNPSHLDLVTLSRNVKRPRSTRAASGVRGVTRNRSGNYVVRIGHDYKKHYGGTFKTLAEAERAAGALVEALERRPA